MHIKRAIYSILSGLLLAAAIAVGGSGTAMAAANGADFHPGHIIDDQIFFNGNDMSVAQIQAFLNQEVPSCDNGGNLPYYGTYGGVYHNGDVLRKNLDPNFPPPYTCLRDFYVNPTTHASNYGSSVIPAGAISAAQLIYNEAQAYNINPKVLLVLLQKESSLVTDDWPWSTQYRTATGYGCPDSTGCSSAYYGFDNQVMNSAKEFRNYTNNPNNFNYTIGLNNILYHPAPSSCGTEQVNILNQATADLYDYTPYVPNQAALNNLYGTGDSCSSYGNRNFWRMYTDWFGSTLVPTYQWAYAGQTSSIPLNGILPGTTATFTVSATNTGSATWTNAGANPVRLGTSNPLNRSSAFATNTWLSSARPATMNESSVAPGQTGTFTFTIQAPSTPGHYKEYFQPLAEGLVWFNDPGLYFDITVVPPTWTWSLSSQAAYTDSSKAQAVDLTSLSPGQTAWLVVKGQNTGNMTWSNTGTNPVRLGTDSPRERVSKFATSAWLSPTRPATMDEASVAPGGTATFEFPITVPAGNGTVDEHFTPVVEGKTWMNNLGMNFHTVILGQYSWSVASQYAFTDASKTTPANMNQLSPGQRVYVGLTAKNTGNNIWYSTGAYPIDMSTVQPMDRMSAFCDASWLGCDRPARLIEASVGPGQTGTFEFWYDVPAVPGTYHEHFAPVAENYAHFSDIGLNYQSGVGTLAWSLVTQSAFSDSGYSTPIDLGSLTAGQVTYWKVTAKNTGSATWYNSGAYPMDLGTTVPRDRTSAFCDPSWLVCARPARMLESSVAPGATGTFEFKTVAPGTAGSYHEYFNPVAEGAYWLNDPGMNFFVQIH
jgi:hypothetical protein